MGFSVLLGFYPPPPPKGGWCGEEQNRGETNFSLLKAI